MRFSSVSLGVQLTGVGAHAPAMVLANSAFESSINTTDDWIRSRTGIAHRRVMTPNESLWELCVPAAQDALRMAAVSPDAIDLIIVATSSSDFPMPSTGALLQAALGASKAVAFDIQAACTGFIYALITGAQFLRAGHYRNALIVGADALSRFMDPCDRTTSILFGDGAGALVMQASPEEGLHAELMATDGGKAKLLMIREKKDGPPAPERMQRKPYMTMEGRELYRIVLETVPAQIKQACETAGLSLQDIDHFLFHQANARMLEAISERLGVSLKRVPMILRDFGNTSAASIPMLLAHEVAQERIQRGEKICLSGFGAGLAWGTAIATWSGGPLGPTAN
ncbi:MAG: beta-ketoacyl-ACP synthase III [Candidatus Sericytochromatia bacterium]|nr:beta-ketoacyl-ACP synthase III [Candidatus Sericytochromatia bacterium]